MTPQTKFKNLPVIGQRVILPRGKVGHVRYIFDTYAVINMGEYDAPIRIEKMFPVISIPKLSLVVDNT